MKRIGNNDFELILSVLQEYCRQKRYSSGDTRAANRLRRARLLLRKLERSRDGEGVLQGLWKRLFNRKG